MSLTVGVLALQGAFIEHITLLRRAAEQLSKTADVPRLTLIEVRTTAQLQLCDALVIPGGESTTISLIAATSDLLEALREFVKVERKPVWGTCAGLILLAEAANSTKKGGQELIGGLDVRVNRNHFGRQIESFVTDVRLPFLDPVAEVEAQKTNSAANIFPGVFIRAPIVEKILENVEGAQTVEQEVPDSIVAPSKKAKNSAAIAKEVDIMAVLPGRVRRAAEKGLPIEVPEEAGDIVAVRQGNVFGTSFHPELTDDVRLHIWWLKQVIAAAQTTSQHAAE